MSFRRSLLIFALLVSGAAAFVPASQPRILVPKTTNTQQQASSTALAERRWNFNEGQSPWGLKKNAEIWNGRVAQMAFVLVFIQELVQGKGVIQGISEGDPVNLAALGVIVITTVGLTGFLALQGDDDYTLNQS